jgi:hypothetical protein
MNFLNFNQKTNLEIDKLMNSAGAELGLRLGTAGLTKRQKWFGRRKPGARHGHGHGRSPHPVPRGVARSVGSHRPVMEEEVGGESKTVPRGMCQSRQVAAWLTEKLCHRWGGGEAPRWWSSSR